MPALFMEISEVATLLRRRDVSSVELTTGLLDRIHQVDPRLNSFALVLADRAVAEARAADAAVARGNYRGPLHGIPVAVKDLLWTAGSTTAAGSTILQDFVPDTDAVAVRGLRAAGGILLGKLRMTDGAFGQHHPDLPTPINPWDADAWVGVSSSGPGVAVAARLCFGALGSDTGGSIRYPSAATGITGLKTTWGLIDRFGAFELAGNLDTIGPMARSAADCAILFDAIARRDGREERVEHDLRLGVDPRVIDTVDPPTAMALRTFLEVAADQRWTVVETTQPGGPQVVADWRTIVGVEAARAHRDTFPSRRSEYAPMLAGLLDAGLAEAPEAYAAALARRARFENDAQQVFTRVDLLLSPVSGVASPTTERMDSIGRGPEFREAFQAYTTVFNMSRNPTLTLPAGFTDRGTPIGVQLVGRHHAERLLLRAGQVYQEATDHHRRLPPL